MATSEARLTDALALAEQLLGSANALDCQWAWAHNGARGARHLSYGQHQYMSRCGRLNPSASFTTSQASLRAVLNVPHCTQCCEWAVAEVARSVSQGTAWVLHVSLEYADLARALDAATSAADLVRLRAEVARLAELLGGPASATATEPVLLQQLEALAKGCATLTGHAESRLRATRDQLHAPAVAAALDPPSTLPDWVVTGYEVALLGLDPGHGALEGPLRRALTSWRESFLAGDPPADRLSVMLAALLPAAAGASGTQLRTLPAGVLARELDALPEGALADVALGAAFQAAAHAAVTSLAARWEARGEALQAASSLVPAALAAPARLDLLLRSSPVPVLALVEAAVASSTVLRSHERNGVRFVQVEVPASLLEAIDTHARDFVGPLRVARIPDGTPRAVVEMALGLWDPQSGGPLAEFDEVLMSARALEGPQASAVSLGEPTVAPAVGSPDAASREDPSSARPRSVRVRPGAAPSIVG